METAVKLTCAAFLLTLSGPSIADTVLSPTPHSDPAKPAPEFSCAGKPVDLSRDALEKIALAEYERRSGRALRPGEFEASLKRRGCDWWVFVSRLPAAPGAHFVVVVDGFSGKAKEYGPGF
jgi:hypothetical protein